MKNNAIDTIEGAPAIMPPSFVPSLSAATVARVVQTPPMMKLSPNFAKNISFNELLYILDSNRIMEMLLFRVLL